MSRENSVDNLGVLPDNSHELMINEYYIKKCKYKKLYSCIKLRKNDHIYQFKIKCKRFLIETYADTVKEFIFLRNRIKYCWYDKCRRERDEKFVKYIENTFNNFIKLNNLNPEIDKYKNDMCNIQIFKKTNLVKGDDFWIWTVTRDNEHRTDKTFDEFRRELAILQIDFLIFMIIDMTNILNNPIKLHEMRNSYKIT